MWRVAILLVLLFVGPVASAADLPPGALVRLGDDRFRAGGEVEYVAFSPDGKQVATVAWVSKGVQALAVWDAATGNLIREYKVNRQLFKGFVWSERGASAIVLRAESATKDKRATVFRDDFRVWDFAKTSPPLLPQDKIGLGSPTYWVDADWQQGPEYTDFRFSADGARVAATWKSDEDKHAIHVFDLKPTDTATKLKRAGTLDLGAEGVDAVRISADGKSVVTFRRLADLSEMTATTWNVATGKPSRPVRVPFAERPMVAPDVRAIVVPTDDFNDDGPKWGFDRYDLVTGEKRKLIRWKYNFDEGTAVRGGAFTPSGRELIVTVHTRSWRAYVIDLTTGQERGHLEGHVLYCGEGAGNQTAVSADGSRIATADGVGLIRLWDTKTLRPLSDVTGHHAEVERIQFSPDSKRVLTWAPDRTVRLWDLTTGKELRAFAGAIGDYPPVFALDGTAIVYRDAKALIARDLQTGLEVPLPKNADGIKPRAVLDSTTHLSAGLSLDGTEVWIHGLGGHCRTLTGHRGLSAVLGFTPDGKKLLTVGGDHTVLVWDMRLQHVPLPDALKNETDAAKLWGTLATANAKDAYLAMVRLAREPEVAIKLVKMRLKPAAEAGEDTDATKLTDARAIELLEALDADGARALLKELAGGHADAFRTQEAKRALERKEKK